MRVLGRVAAQCGENPHRLINQGSSALFISRGLAGPKFILNRNDRKGNALIFVCLQYNNGDGLGKIYKSYVRLVDKRFLENCHSEKEIKSQVP